MSETETANIRASADRLGIRDIFILRRVEDDRFVHVGGIGRGKGWAGLTEIRLRENAPAREAYDEDRVAMVNSSSDKHVFGPYWARWAAFVPVDHDVLVVFGQLDHEATDFETDSLRQAALVAAKEIDVISPAKRLADELEVLHTVQKLMAIEPTTATKALQHIVDCATEALSCEFGVAWFSDRPSWVASRQGWQPAMGLSAVARMLRERYAAETPPVCVQDASTQPLPRPFRTEDGVCSYYMLSIGSLSKMLLVHTRAEPRGFTQLCQELGRRLAESSEIVLRTAIQRENLTRELDRVSSEARRDPLTGIGNRLAWEERLSTIAKGGPNEPTGIIYIDLDNLKQVNDRFGHEAGDRIIRTMADILRAHVRPNDFIARLGGDEFAVLLPDSSPEICRNVVKRLNTAAGTTPELGNPIRFTHGSAVCKPGGNVYHTLREADASLIKAKQSRNS